MPTTWTQDNTPSGDLANTIHTKERDRPAGMVGNTLTHVGDAPLNDTGEKIVATLRQRISALGGNVVSDTTEPENQKIRVDLKNIAVRPPRGSRHLVSNYGNNPLSLSPTLGDISPYYGKNVKAALQILDVATNGKYVIQMNYNINANNGHTPETLDMSFTIDVNSFDIARDLNKGTAGEYTEINETPTAEERRATGGSASALANGNHPSTNGAVR